MQTAGVLEKIGVVPTHHDGVKSVLKGVYLDGENRDIARKAILFGGTILFNTANDYLESEYISALKALLRDASGVWMRDVFSVAALEQLGCARARLGTDCALLLRPEDVDPAPCERLHGAAADRVGVFFGRTCGSVQLAAEFTRALSQQLGLRTEWLPWFDAALVGGHYAATRNNLPKLEEAIVGPEPTARDLLRRLSRLATPLS